MAIADNSLVTMKIVSSDFDVPGDWTAQPPINGIAYGGGEGGDFNILWSNGLTSTNVPATVLDEVTAPNIASQNFIGQTAVPFPGASPNFESAVIAVYGRGDTDMALLKSIATGAFMEVPASQLVIVPGH